MLLNKGTRPGLRAVVKGDLTRVLESREGRGLPPRLSQCNSALVDAQGLRVECGHEALLSRARFRGYA